MVTSENILAFRERVNRHDFVLNKYRDYNGKNLWGCICSAMDWITVAVSFFEAHPTPEITADNDDLSSVNVYTYISCIDMVFEAVKQLHKIFVNPNGIPFHGEKTVFKKNIYCEDDNRYFKMLRACFGAHPVDLKDYFSKPEKEQRFASWSGGHFSSQDYGVILYSITPGEQDIPLDVDFEELGAFLARTYAYLDKLIAVIDADEQEHIACWQATEIQQSTDICTQLRILSEENKKRLNNEYYKYVIDSLSIIFASEISNPNNARAVEQYRDRIRPAVDELLYALQKMDHAEIETFENVETNLVGIPHSVSNGLAELSDRVFTGISKYPIWLPSVVKYVSPFVEISGTEDDYELYLLTRAGMDAARRPQI